MSAEITFPVFDAVGFEVLTVDNTSGGVAMDSSKYAPSGRGAANIAMISTETAACRFTVDGTAPTTTVGHLLAAADYFVIRGANNIRRFRAIRTGGTSADLQITYGYVDE